jgi:hypothetical protein
VTFTSAILMSDHEDERHATDRIESATKDEVDGFHRYLKRRHQRTCAIDVSYYMLIVLLEPLNPDLFTWEI